MRYLPSPAETALLIAVNLQRYAKDRGKELGRFRLARSSLRRIAVRTRLEDSWIEYFIEHMLTEYGWLVFVDAEEFLFLKRESTSSWTKIGTKRCDDLLKRLRNGDETAVTDAESELDIEGEDEEGDDAE